MNWGLISTVFFLATVKFMFAPFTGHAIGLPFWETYVSSVAGGTVSATIFFFFSELIMKISHRRKLAKANAGTLKAKRKFTKTNRGIIKVKRSLGIYGICFWAPFFLSVPIGSVVAAKFYGKESRTFPLIILGMFFNALAMSFLAYLIFH
jgi:hypothetical protein